MTKHALLAASAALVMNGFLTAPAFAAKPPLNDTTGLSPQEVCDAQLTPDEHSDFQTYPINESTGDWVNDGPPVQGTAAGDEEGYGTPTASGLTFNGNYYRNGGSPNVWGGASATLTYPQTRQLFNFSQDQIRTTTFDCYVFKIVGHDTIVDPEGLQSTGNSSIEEQTNYYTDYVITDDDFVVYGEEVITLICISPNNTTKSKPGTWTAKHGFTDSCTTASTLAGNLPVPSGNAPTSDAGIVYFPH